LILESQLVASKGVSLFLLPSIGSWELGFAGFACDVQNAASFDFSLNPSIKTISK